MTRTRTNGRRRLEVWLSPEEFAALAKYAKANKRNKSDVARARIVAPSAESFALEVAFAAESEATLKRARAKGGQATAGKPRMRVNRRENKAI